MEKEYIKGLRGEIVSLDSVERVWKVLDEKTGNWGVWADSRKHSTELFEGTEAEVKTFVAALDDLFEPYVLTDEGDMKRLKKSSGLVRFRLEPIVSE